MTEVKPPLTVTSEGFLEYLGKVRHHQSNRSARLRERTRRLIGLLANAFPESVSLDQIADSLDMEQDPEAVRTEISRIRKELLLWKVPGTVIANVRGQGTYRLDGPEVEPLVAVIPVGGAAGQLSPITDGQPKTLLPIGDWPLLYWIISSLPRSVFSKILVVHSGRFVGQMRNFLSKAFPDDFGRRIELPEKASPPAKILKSLNVSGVLGRRFLIHYGDIVLQRSLDWGYIVRQYDDFAATAKPFLGGVLIGSRRYQYEVGVIRRDEADDSLVAEFDEKPARLIGDGILINTAVALLSSDFVEQAIKVTDGDLFGESIARAIQEGTAEFRVLGPFEWLHVQRTSDWIDIQDAYYPKTPGNTKPASARMRERLISVGLTSDT
jgi:dTDP-glucose pyrophosphorylase